MASMYDSVSPSGMVDTVFGNYKPGQKKSALNSVVDGVKSAANIPMDAYRQANKLTNDYFVNPIIKPAAGAVAEGLVNSGAERDYADEHQGMYPPSQEAFSAYKSYKANGGGALNESPPPNSAGFQTNPGISSQYENGLSTAPQKGNLQGVLGLGNTDPAAVQAQQAQSKATAEAKAAAQQQKTAVANGYTPTPDASKDPVGYMAATNMNKAKGVGESTGTMNEKAPAPPTESQQQSIALNQMGKQSAFDMSKAGPWYKSQSFNYGLISFGLNLLSGNDLATSFNAAGQAFGDMYGQEQRGAWAQDLQAQGYSPQEIEEYVRTGDSKTLTDPMEKQARQVQLQTNLQQLDNLQYSNSPEQRQAAIDDKNFDKGIKLATLDNQRAATAGAAADRRESMQLRRDALNFKMQGGADQQPLLYTDTNGKSWEVQRNARGTPLVNANGMAVVRDTETGQTAWRNVSDNQRQMGGIQANEGLAAMDEVQNAGLMQYTGNSLVAKGSRRVRDEMGGNVTSDLSSHFDNINGSVRATLETQLMQENNNRPVQKYMLDTAVKRLGKLDINNSPEENARIMGNYRSVLTSQYNARDETHPSVDNRNYQDPGNRPSVRFDGNGSAVGGRAMPRLGQKVGGMTYVGGDPSKQSSWSH